VKLAMTDPRVLLVQLATKGDEERNEAEEDNKMTLFELLDTQENGQLFCLLCFTDKGS